MSELVHAPPQPDAATAGAELEPTREWEAEDGRPEVEQSLAAIEPGLPEQVQARLVMGRPDDVYEREADRAADAAIGAARPAPLTHDPGATLRRQVEEVEDEDDEEEPVQARAVAGRTAEVTAGLARRIEDASSEGRPLGAGERPFYESRLGHDFGAVRVHTGPRSSAAAAAAGAQAFTRGQDIYFGDDYYRPDSTSGRWLMAHELAHTLQQRPAVVARQPLAAAEPVVEEPVADGVGGDTDATANELTDELQADPRDSSRRLRERLSQLEPAERRAVLARLREGLSPARRIALDTLVDATGESGAGETDAGLPGAGAPGAEAAATEPTAAPGAGAAATEPSAAPGAGVGAEPRGGAGAAGSSAATGRPHARPPAGLTVAPPTPGIAPPATPPTPSTPAPARPAPEAAARGESAAAARTAEGADRRAATAGAGASAAAGQAEAATEAVAAEAEGAEGEAAGAGDEAEGLPSLAELVEPLPEPPVEEAPALEPPEPAPPLEPPGPAGLVPAGAESTEASLPAPPEPESLVPDEGEEPAEPEEPVDVDGMVEQIRAAPAEAEARLEGEAEAVRTAVRQRSGAVIGSVRAGVSRTAAQVGQEFAAKRTALEGALSSARGRVDTQFEAKRAELRTKGDEARTRITGVFDDHRTQIQQAVDGSITATEEIHSRYTGLARTRTAEKARTARQRGAAKASGYPRTKRGRVQANAASGVADRTAREIEGKEQETVEAIEEVVAEIPAKFEEEGRKTLQGYDNPLPGLLADVTRQIAAADEALVRAADAARLALDNLARALHGELDAAESAAIARIEALGPRAESQIGSATRHALREIDQGVPRAMENIDPVADEAAGILQETEEPDAERSRAFTDAVLSFIGGAADEGSAALGEAGQLVTEQLQGADTSAKGALGTARRQATTQMTAAEEQRNRRLSSFSTWADGELTAPLMTFETHIAQTETRTREGFAPAVRDLQAKFSTTLRDADSRSGRALNEGMAKNDEALGELDGKMNEAASDAAWDYDHPILSAIGDVLSVIAGVIVGILAVIALVVVVIVAVKLLVAGLVVLGVAAATAALVGKIVLIGVAVAGIAMLAYGAYQSYSARRAQGASVLGALGGAVADVTGVTDMRRAFDEEGLSPFDRGFFFGRGAATLVTTVIGGRKMVTRFRSRMPARLPNPGSARAPTPRAAPPAGASPAPPAATAAPTPASAGAPRAAPAAAPGPAPAGAPATAPGAPRPATIQGPAGAPAAPRPTTVQGPAPAPTARPTTPPTAAPTPAVQGAVTTPAAPPPHLRPLPTQQAPRLSPPRGQLRSVPLEPRPATPSPAARPTAPQAQPQIQAQPQQLQLAAGGEGRVIVGGGPTQPRLGVIQGGARGTPAGGRVAGDVQAIATRGPTAGGGARTSAGGGGARTSAGGGGARTSGGGGGARTSGGGGGARTASGGGGGGRTSGGGGGGGRGRPRPGGGGGARARRTGGGGRGGAAGGGRGTARGGGGRGAAGGGRGGGRGGGGRGGGGRGGRRRGGGGPVIESVGRPVKLPFTAADIRKFVAGIGARGQAPRLSRAGGRPRIPAQGAPGRPLRSVPRRNPRRHVFDIENLPRRPGETARQAVARVRQVVGKTINDIPGASKLWNQARRTVMGGTRLTSKNAVSFYERTRPVFWRLVRGNPAVRARFERAGFEFTGSSGSAPVIKGIRPHQPVYQGARGTAPQTTPPRGRTTRRPQISPRELRLSLDHTSRKSVDWRSALDPKNLQIMPERPNWFREVVQSRHDIPD